MVVKLHTSAVLVCCLQVEFTVLVHLRFLEVGMLRSAVRIPHPILQNLIIPKISRLSWSSRVKHTVEEIERFHIIFSNILKLFV